MSNALAAAAVGHALGLSGAAIAEGLAKFRPAAMRSQISSSHGVQVINDCYNANPASMKAAIQLLAQLGRETRTIDPAALGDMLELGRIPNACIRTSERFSPKQGIRAPDGPWCLGTGAGGRVHVKQACRLIGLQNIRMPRPQPRHGTGWCDRATMVLVKASRGISGWNRSSALTGMRRVAKKAC